MSVARHPRSSEYTNKSLEEIIETHVGRFRDRSADWNAFADANIEGYKRAQHRFIGAGASGKHDDKGIIPAGNFTLSIMYVPPGQGNAPHTHEVEEVFFVLEGYMTVFIEEEDGRRVSRRLGKWECISCPAGVIHGYVNESLEPCYLQVMLGRGRPETAGFANEELFEKRSSHLK
jgi:mannose-6-phosphate isomerase-like protein (cupin superfamily)